MYHTSTGSWCSTKHLLREAQRVSWHVVRPAAASGSALQAALLRMTSTAITRCCCSQCSLLLQSVVVVDGAMVSCPRVT